jgi:beta-carotene 3-hydroxylase
MPLINLNKNHNSFVIVVMILYAIIFLTSFFGMEFVAWFTHKYIMHGFLWSLHKSHHETRTQLLEKNDWFSIIFAVPSWLFIMLGIIYSSPISVLIGAGMTAYGAAYFIVHDVIIHQRVKLFRNLDSNYVKTLRRAHKMHHKHLGKEDGESFGFLIVNKKYLNY